MRRKTYIMEGREGWDRAGVGGGDGLGASKGPGRGWGGQGGSVTERDETLEGTLWA